MTKLQIRRNIGIEDSRRLGLIKLHSTTFIPGELVQTLYRTEDGGVDTLLALGISHGQGEDHYKLISSGGINVIEDIVESLPDISNLTHQERYIWKNEGSWFEVYKDPQTNSRLLNKLEEPKEYRYYCASNGYIYYFSSGKFKREDDFTPLSEFERIIEEINNKNNAITGRVSELEDKDTKKQSWLEEIDTTVFPVELKVSFLNSIPSAKKSVYSDYSGVEDLQYFDYSISYLAKYKLTATIKGVDVISRCTFRLKGQTEPLRISEGGIFTVPILKIEGSGIKKQLEGEKLFVLLITKDGEQIRRNDGLRFISNTIEYTRIDPILTVSTIPVKYSPGKNDIIEIDDTERPEKIQIKLGEGDIKLTLGGEGKIREKYEGTGKSPYRHAIFFPKKFKDLLGFNITEVIDQNGMNLSDIVETVDIPFSQVPEKLIDRSNPLYRDSGQIAMFLKESVLFDGPFNIIFKYTTNA